MPGASAAQNVQTLIDQGMQASQAGRYDQALQAFDQALKLKPNDPALISYKATVYYAKGNNAQAMQLIEQIIKQNPNFGRAYYQRAMILEKQEKYGEALEDLKKAKSLGYGIDPDFIALMERKAAAKK
jgi:tetratricopeptide (TPR) repeat protein